MLLIDIPGGANAFRPCERDPVRATSGNCRKRRGNCGGLNRMLGVKEPCCRHRNAQARWRDEALRDGMN